MSRATRRAKQRAKQAAAEAQDRAAQRSAAYQQRQHTEDEPPPEFFYYESASGGLNVDADNKAVQNQTALDFLTWCLKLLLVGMLGCAGCALWWLGHDFCGLAALFLMFVWAPRKAPGTARGSNIRKGGQQAEDETDDILQFSSKEQAWHFLQLAFHMHAMGHLSDAVLAELLHKYQQAGGPEPCICGECRARMAAAARQQQQQRQQQRQRFEEQLKHAWRQQQQQARQEERQRQQQQQQRRRDQQWRDDGHGKFDSMMGFGPQTLPPDACAAVQSVLLAADYYAVLGLSSDKTSTGEEFEQQLKAARRRVALAVHPDKVGSSGHIAASRVNLAFTTLSDDVERGEYDAYLRRCRRSS